MRRCLDTLRVLLSTTRRIDHSASQRPPSIATLSAEMRLGAVLLERGRTQARFRKKFLPVHGWWVHPFSQKSRTPTVAKEFQIGLYDPAEADLELFCNSWSAGFLRERL